MSALLVGAVALLLVVPLFIWWIAMLVDALRVQSSRWAQAGESQTMYVLLMALLPVVGTILYVAVARPKLR